MMEGLCFVLMFLFALDTVLCQDFKLFVADNQGKIYTLNETGEIIDTITTNESVIGIAADPFLSSPDDISILYSAHEGGNGWIYRHNLTDGTSESLVAVEIQGFNAYATSLQVDPTSGNIFFTRILDGIQGYNLISAQSPYADQTTILPDLNSPSAIAVHAGRGLLFWSDSSNSPFIGSATMAGTESGQLIKTDIEEPTGLAIDFIADKLYWADASLHKIESCYFDGEDRNVVLSVPNTEIKDLVLDGDYLYYNSRTNNEITRVHISDSGDLTTFATISDAAILNGMTIYSQNLLYQNTSDICSPRFGLGDCSTICLPTPSGHSCACGFDIELLENGKTCKNATVCPDSLPNGHLDFSCTRHRFDTCNFTCDEGFLQDIVEISCNGVGWNDANPCSSAVLGGICSEPGTSCHDANSLCDPDKGKCSCKEGFFDNDGDSSNFDGTCVQKVLVGSKCVTNVSDSCMDENASCDPATKQCICGRDFYDDDGDNTNVGGVCIPKKAVGESCSVVAADSCRDANAVCNSTTTQCTCLPEYYDIDGDSSNIGGNCIKKAGLQENCSIQAVESCYDVNALCDAVTVKCSCSTGYSAVGGMCTADCPKLPWLENGYYGTDDVSEGTVVTAECNQTFTLFGNSSLLCLSGGIWNSPNPECRKDCKELSPSAHELFDSTDVKEGTTIKAACDNGYSMFGNQFITCLPGGIWHEDTSRGCRKDCPTPAELVFGYSNSTELKEGSKITMACNYGYSVFGNPVLTCLPGGIWDRDQDIECREGCPYINIEAQLNTTETKEGTVVYVKCNKDFTLFGDDTLICLPSGAWDPSIPDCKKDCPALEPFPGGQLNTTAVLEGTLATVTCEPEHRLSGSDIITCMPGGIWSSNSTCMKDCPELENPVNGYLEYHGDFSTENMVNVRCDYLYTLVGHSELRCLAGGIWDLAKMPECIKDCDQLDHPNNGWVETTGLSHGSVASYKCYTGFLMTGKVVQTCLDGTWSDAMPTCSPVDCGEVNITNGNVIGSTLYGGRTRVRCEPGYNVVGNIWCGSDGLWYYYQYYYQSTVYSRTNILCHPMDCRDPSNLTNTFIQYQGTLVGSIATYFVQFGKRFVSTLQFTCKEDGLWSGKNIECSIKDSCERLNNLLYGYVEITGYHCGAVAVYRCYEGHKMEGTPIRHCINGIWNGSEPVCSRVDCGYIYVDNGVLEGSTYYGDSLYLVCDNGYYGYYEGEALFECRSDGFWETRRWYGSDKCYRKYCGTPVAPNNGLAVYHGTHYGDVAGFVCAFGYKLTGSQQQVCQGNGTWSDGSIACELIDCPPLQAPENGLLSSLSHNVGAYVTVSCNETYMYFGDAVLVCLLGGTWTGSVGQCADSCEAGTYITDINNIPTCLKCPKGEYQPQKNQDECLKCDDNSTTVKTGTTKKNLCFPECRVGHGLVYGATKTCHPCSVGQYNNKTGDNPNICKDCPNGLTTDSEGQAICTVPIPIFEPYDVHVYVSLIYEAETDCSDASLDRIRETLQDTITGVLELHAEQYIGLCGFKETTCNNVKISLGNCTNVIKRDTTSPLQVDVSIPEISNTVEDTNDSNNKLSTGNVIAEIFETGLGVLQSQLGELNALQLSAAPTVVPTCNPGFIVQGSKCEPCVPGTFWVNNSGSCSDCPADTYQENFAQAQCTDCPELKYTAAVRSDNPTACTSFCDVNPAYCNFHGQCIATGRRTSECVCYIGYNGTWCEQDIDECLTDNGGCKNECTNFDGGYACSCLDGYYQDSRDPTKCRVNLFKFGEEAGDQMLQDIDYGCSEPIAPSVRIPIYGNKHDTFYVCANGLVSFDDEYWYSWPPGNIEKLSDRTILAPFFTNMEFSGIGGAIYYHEYNPDNTISFESNLNVQQAKLYISDIFGNSIDIKYLFVATWFQARRDGWLSSYYVWFNEDDGRWEYDYIPENAEKNVTFQLVIATDRTTTYAMYLYGDQQMNWVKTSELKKPNVFIGYSVKGGIYFSVSSYSYTNLALEMDHYAETADIKGILMYNLKKPGFSPPDFEALCLDWYDELRFQDDHPEIALTCPCNIDLMIWDPWFVVFDDYYDLPDSGYDDVKCYDSWPSWRRSPNAMRCCYDKVSGGWISDERKAGGLIFYHPRSHPTFHQKYDVEMKNHCCNASDNCDKFRQLRPVGSCYDEFPWELGSMFGDPHISTLDGKSYTFNGWGEYALLKIKTNDTDFSLQCRTERALTEDGKLTDATVFTAFASLDSSNASLLVELAANKAGMVIFGNGVDLTLQFQNKSMPFAFQQSNLILTRQNESLDAFFIATGVKIKISLGTEMLTQEVTVPKEYQGLTKGLLGNFDGNASNDFTFRDGHIIDANSSEREVFPFGQSWMTLADESIFAYGKGLNHANFSHPEFTPKFLDEADPKLVENATVTCGETNLECIFDLVFTGNDKLAIETQYTSVQHAESLVVTHNKIPSLNGTKRIEINSGEAIFIPINAFDEEDVTFTLSDGFDASLVNITGNSAYIYLRASELLGEQLSVMATDVLGKTSAPFVIEVVICSGCSGHGLCNFKEYQNATKHTNPVKYAKCICDGGSLPYWAGENCEHDFDGCSYQPCSVGQDCIDYNATYHQFQAKAYGCSACPDGYDTNNDKCQDRNECLDSNGGCQQACINTEGSFQCLCNSGYRLSIENPNLCEDIHECDEALHSCQHTCINTVGAYNCSCHQGFRLDVDGFACIREEDVCADSNIDCSATAGCKKDTGVAECFCNTGFELSDSGLECVNVDECLENVCSQTCTDTEGSFKCGCQPGFTLENDGTTCVECDESHWGLNCANICKCGQGALRCDRSKGCVCKHGWSEPSCNADVDECAQTPNVCNDVNKDCTNTIGSYECSCRDGFQLDQNEMCEDINECNSLALNECKQICSNVLGSFTCSCNSGYLSDPSDAFKCIDLDECVTGNADCEQLCVNVAGGFNCDCHFGYLLNDDRKTCRKVEDVCAVYGNLNCSHFCVVNATETLCKCPSGFEIGSDNQTCLDIKECDDPILNVCSQPETCQDFEGGYQCSCQIGFKLENDGRTCRPCDDFHFGMNCDNKCDCGVGADICDPVSGCICMPGWNGTHCEQDNDECNTEYSPCAGVDTECVNTPGSYKCVCRNGFEFASNGSCFDINECEAPGLNICDQNCTNTVGSFICTCADGFMFINGSCQDIDECLGLNDCQQKCINTVGGHRCRCKPGYILDLKNRKACIPETECSGSDADTCLSQNAECVMVNGQPTCECQQGYAKDSDDICADIKECDLTPCSQICLEEDGGYSCQCESGFKLGPDSKTCFACEDGTYGTECSLSCTCNVETTIECDRTTGDCTCSSGWTGNTCSDDIDECSASEDFNCTANSECVNTNGSYICECTDGFINGSHGDCIDIDECAEQTDLCSQDCINTIGGYDCQCLPGYKSSGNNCTDCEAGRWGIECQEYCLCIPENTEDCSSDTGHCLCKTGWSGPRCESDIDECHLINTCDSTTETCENTNGSFVCKCNKGLGREETKGCIDIDECLAGIAECFQECVNTHGSYECRCNQGYKSEGKNCSDIDECAEGTDLCSQDCINTIGSYECQCSAGYKSSGYSCTECESGKWGDECQNDCLCEPDNTDFCSTDTGHCECQNGWAGLSCETDINECLQGDICDSETEVCENRNSTYDCKCKDGLGRHDVLGCIDIDECIEGLVSCDHFCVNTYGSYNCQCNKGYKSHGNNCTDVDECSEGIARCPQECINIEGSYTCNCSAGYQTSNYSCAECENDKWGDKCQNDCHCIPENTKSCNSADGHCDCQKGWTGDSCEKDINECFKNDTICDVDTEECENTDGSYKCHCKAGLGRYEGVCRDIDECVEELDDCIQDCINTHGSYQCRCRPGFSSSENICTECEPGKWGYECNETCACVQENTRSCSPVHGYCHCNTGWYGQACENDTDECLERHSCNTANEVCQNTAGSYMCNCKEGFKRDGDACAVSCLQGTYKSFDNDVVVCMPCPRGEYQDEVDRDFCIQCDSGYTTKKIGSLTSQQCFPECDVGQGLIYDAAKICQPCAKGQYNDKTGENPNLCKECPSGLTTARAGQSVCTVSAPVVAPYQTVIALPLLFEVNTDCAAASLLGIRESIKTTIKTRLMEYEKRYQGLCGVDKKSCNDISVNLGPCASLKKREATHLLEVNVSISDISSTIRDTEDQNTSLSTVNLVAELFESDPNGFTPQGGQGGIQYIRLAAAPTATVMCDPGQIFADGRCQCPNNHYGDDCSAQCECETENTVTPTQSCDPDSGKCLCLPTWGGERCSMDIDECLSGTHNCDAVENRMCQNSIDGFNCICKTGYSEGPNHDCIKDKEDNYGLVVGLSIGIPLGVLALVAINLLFCLYLRRSNKKSVPEMNVREEFVSSVYRNMPTRVPEGTAAFRSIGSWYSAPVTPTPSSSRGSYSGSWIGMPMGENRRLHIDRPKVSTRPSDLFQE